MTSTLLDGVGAVPDVAHEPEVLPRPDRSAGLVLDLAAGVTALLLIASVTVASSWVLRPVVALVFALFVPGWAMVRAFGARAELLSLVVAVALSITCMILIGQGLVLFGNWKWFPVSCAYAATAAWGCGASAMRELAGGRRPTSVDPPPARSPGAVVAIATVAVGNALVLVGVRGTDLVGVDLYGLVDRLSVWYWIGVAVIVLGLVVGCLRSPRWAWLNVAGLAVVLHGLPGLLEPHPRFSVSWIHAGFAQQIAEHGTLLTALDARFSWAGFFSGAGLLQRLAGTDSLLWLVRFAPLFVNGCAIALVALLARRLRATEVQTVAAATLFCVLNWIGQDYFAPQATAFLLYLAVIVVLLTVFPEDPAGMTRWVRRLVRPATDQWPASETPARLWILAGCYIAVVAITVSHQLTPGFLLSATLLLVLFRTVSIRTMPIFIGIVFLAWLSFGASSYWSGHFDTLTGSVGKVGSIVNQNVGNRAGSTRSARQVVVYSRMALAAAGWGLAGLSIVVQWFRRRTPVALACLLVAPFPLLPLQPYGGEMVLRVAFFSLPAVAILIAMLVVPSTRRLTVLRATGLGVALAVLVPAFVTARFGNESFEAFSDADVAVSAAMYDTVPDGSLVFVASRQTLLYWQRVDAVHFRTLPPGTGAEVTDTLAADYLDRSPVYVLLSESQAAYGIVSGGLPTGWLDGLARELLATGRYRVVVRDGGAVLMQLEPS